jgi:hypothetical protein
MVKFLIEDEETSLLLSKKENQIVIEMIENGVSLRDLQLGDNYNKIILDKNDAIELCQLLSKLLDDGNQ